MYVTDRLFCLVNAESVARCLCKLIGCVNFRNDTKQGLKGSGGEKIDQRPLGPHSSKCYERLI